MSGAETDTNTAEQALEQIGIYLTWVPPDHAKAARTAEHDLSAALSRLSGRVTELEQALREIAEHDCAKAGCEPWMNNECAIHMERVAAQALTVSAGQA